MAPKLQLSAILFLVVLLPAGAAAFNITDILSEAPSFNTFNTLLSRTHIAAEINRRQTITVLAFDDSAAGDLYYPDDILSQILSVHVILDYYDPAKLKALKHRSTLLTTLFQTTGVAKNNMGFVNFTHLADDRQGFSSGVPGSELAATLVKSVAAQPYNISVLQIGAPIVPEGIDTVAKAPFGSVPMNSIKPKEMGSASSPPEAPEVESPTNASEEKEKSGDAKSGDAEEAAGPSMDKEDKEKSSAGRAASVVSFLAATGVVFLFM